MPRQWTKTSAFGSFGVALENVRWSWSGISDDQSTVAVVLWQDRIKRIDGRLSYEGRGTRVANGRSAVGAERRKAHLNHAIRELGGQFRAIIAVPTDAEASPRQIERCFPQPDIVWQVDDFNTVDGSFTAHALGVNETATLGSAA